VVPCTVCGTLTWFFNSRLARVKEPTCSKQCNGRNRSRELVKHSANGLGKKRPGTGLAMERNPAWKGGVTHFKTHGNYTGVRYVRAPEWARPMARADGYIMEHRLVMAGLCGYLLERSEVVNHEDHDPSNNTPANLTLWPSNAAHKRYEWGKGTDGAACRLASWPPHRSSTTAPSGA